MEKESKINNLPNISIITTIHNTPELYETIKYNWDNIDYPKDKLEWIIIDTSREKDIKHIPLEDSIIYIHLEPNEYLDKITFNKDEENLVYSYHKKMNVLPIGFTKDYAVGLTSGEYIIHFDIDTIYKPKTIKRKLDFLKKNKLECVYCNRMLAHVLNDRENIYKIEDKISGFDSTLFYSKEFWNRGGFKWDDIVCKAITFYHGKGLNRGMDNYYDSIKLINVNNINQYKPIKVELENVNIDIPDNISSIHFNVLPLSYKLNDLYYKKDINVVGLNSKILNDINKEKWNILKVDVRKQKEKILINQIKNFNENINILFVNTKNPIWKIFDKIKFDCVILESEKTFDQMTNILETKNYILLNGIYFEKDFLIN